MVMMNWIPAVPSVTLLKVVSVGGIPDSLGRRLLRGSPADDDAAGGRFKTVTMDSAGFHRWRF
jgi:hypothetical protein